MNEVAPVTVHAASVDDVDSAFLGFVLGVDLAVFSEFVGSMGELAFFFVGTESIFDKLFAELAFLLVLRSGIVGMIMRVFGGGASKVPGGLWGIGGGGGVAGLVEAFSGELEGIFLDELPASCGHGSVDKLLLINLLVGI